MGYLKIKSNVDDIFSSPYCLHRTDEPTTKPSPSTTTTLKRCSKLEVVVVVVVTIQDPS